MLHSFLDCWVFGFKIFIDVTIARGTSSLVQCSCVIHCLHNILCDIFVADTHEDESQLGTSITKVTSWINGCVTIANYVTTLYVVPMNNINLDQHNQVNIVPISLLIWSKVMLHSFMDCCIDHLHIEAWRNRPYFAVFWNALFVFKENVRI